jgi:hypothetical protein
MQDPKTIEEAVEQELNSIQSTISSFETPQDALNHLITWHIDAALDPVINGGKALVELTTLQNLEKLQKFMKDQGIPTFTVEPAPSRDVPQHSFYRQGETTPFYTTGGVLEE